MDQTTKEITIKEVIINLKDWYYFLLSKWKILILFGLIGATYGLYEAWTQKPVYTAVTTYALDDESGGGGMSGALGLASSLGFNLGGTGAGGAFGSGNLMDLMHSRSLIEKTLLAEVEVQGKKMSLAEFYIDISNLRKTWAEKPDFVQPYFPINSNRANFTRIQDSVLGIISAGIDRDQLSITQKDKKLSIGMIEVKSGNEAFAKLFCETLVKEVSAFYIETKSRKAKNNVAILQKQADSIRLELNNAINGVAEANDNTFNLNSAMSIKKVSVLKRQVDVQANTAILTQLVANLEMSKLALLKETPLIQIIDRPILPLKKEKKGRLKNLIIWGFLFGFLTTLYLIFRKVLKNIMK